jgi:cytochrome c oxidase assembly protein subunit 11
MGGREMTRNTKTLATILLLVAAMIGLAFASVPLYRLFCQKTGFGGTTQRADALPGTVLDREVIIKFDSNTSRDLNWSFKPEKREETVKLGQQGLIAFIASNKDKTPTTGTALYNVNPPKAGQYFHKIQCFCFGEQMLKPGEEMHMPVMFYVDPKLNEDREMDDVKVITLSYTFYPAASEELDRAQEAFYNGEKPDNTP